MLLNRKNLENTVKWIYVHGRWAVLSLFNTSALVNNISWPISYHYTNKQIKTGDTIKLKQGGALKRPGALESVYSPWKGEEGEQVWSSSLCIPSASSNFSSLRLSVVGLFFAVCFILLGETDTSRCSIVLKLENGGISCFCFIVEFETRCSQSYWRKCNHFRVSVKTELCRARTRSLCFEKNIGNLGTIWSSEIPAAGQPKVSCKL